MHAFVAPGSPVNDVDRSTRNAQISGDATLDEDSWIQNAISSWRRMCENTECHDVDEFIGLQLRPFISDINPVWKTSPMVHIFEALSGGDAFPLRCDGQFENCKYPGSNVTIGVLGHANDLRATLCVIERKLGLPVKWQGVADSRFKTDSYLAARPMDDEPSFDTAAASKLMALEAREVIFEQLVFSHLEREASEFHCIPHLPAPPPAPPPMACPSTFHVHRVQSDAHLAELWATQRCGTPSFEKEAALEALEHHPCHTQNADDAGAVLLVDGLHRELGDHCERASRALLSSLPKYISEHPKLFFVPDGPIANYGQMRMEWPLATWLTVEPQVSCAGETEYDEFGLSSCWNDAPAATCLPYACHPRVVGIPYIDAYTARSPMEAEARPKLVSYYAGMHGLDWAVDLRRRLYDVCDDDWLCPTDAAGAQDIFLHSTFCLVPAGDTPSRGITFTAMRTGCVPVLFSGCEDSFYYSAYASFLGHDSATGFGLRTWSVLLNTTAVLTDDTYVTRTLQAIAEDQGAMARVRHTMRVLSGATTYDLEVSKRSGFTHPSMLTALADILMAGGTSCEEGELTLPPKPFDELAGYNTTSCESGALPEHFNVTSPLCATVNVPPTPATGLFNQTDPQPNSSHTLTAHLLLVVSDHGTGSTSYVGALGTHQCAVDFGEPFTFGKLTTATAIDADTGFAGVITTRTNEKLEHNLKLARNGKGWVDPIIPASAYECLSVDGIGVYLMRVAQHVCSGMPSKLVHECGGRCVAVAKLFPAHVGGDTDPYNTERVFDMQDPWGQGLHNRLALMIWNHTLHLMNRIPNAHTTILTRDEGDRQLSNWRRFMYKSEWFDCDVERTGKLTVYEASARAITGAPVVDSAGCRTHEGARQCIQTALDVVKLAGQSVTVSLMNDKSLTGNQGITASCDQGGWLKGSAGNYTAAVAVSEDDIARETAMAYDKLAARERAGHMFNARCELPLVEPTVTLPSSQAA
jgi:hypothetical protein